MSRCVVAMVCILTTLLLFGCQSPVVPVKNISYDVSVQVDGYTYKLTTKYKCYYEDIAWLSERGADWHIRGNEDPLKITGTLHDGSRFEALPFNLYRPNDPYSSSGGRCPEHSRDVETMFYIEDKRNPSHVEGFSTNDTTSNLHKVKILDSGLHIDSFGVAPFHNPQHDKPGPVRDGKAYYTVSMTVLAAPNLAMWKGLGDFIQQKHLPWLIRGGDNPFHDWTSDDVDFSRNYSQIFTWKTTRTTTGAPLADVVEYYGTPIGDEWQLQQQNSQSASQWHAEPPDICKIDCLNPEHMTKKWIRYDGAHIEIEFSTYFRYFYDPVRNEIISLSVEHVHLW